MVKYVQINLRIPVEQHKFIKEMNAKQIEIWQIGFEKWAMEYPEFLQEKAQEYKNLYIKIIESQGILYKNAIQKNVVLEDLYKLYISQDRDVNHPTAQDKSWVKAKLGHLENGNRFSVTQAFEYFQKRFNQDKQKHLEVDE